jgi:hypothetical protein
MMPSLLRMRMLLRMPSQLKSNTKLILTPPIEMVAAKNSSQLSKKLKVKEVKRRRRKLKILRNLVMITANS